MKKIIFRKSDATVLKKIAEYFDVYLTELIITCAFLFILLR